MLRFISLRPIFCHVELNLLSRCLSHTVLTVRLYFTPLNLICDTFFSHYECGIYVYFSSLIYALCRVTRFCRSLIIWEIIIPLHIHKGMWDGLCSTERPIIGQLVAYFAVHPELAVQSKNFVVDGRQHL